MSQPTPEQAAEQIRRNLERLNERADERRQAEQPKPKK